MKKQSHGTCVLRVILLISKWKLQITSGRISPIQNHLVTQVLSQLFTLWFHHCWYSFFIFIFSKHLIFNILFEFQEKALKLLSDINGKLNDLGRIYKPEGSIINTDY